jgi:hypothetical protein
METYSLFDSRAGHSGLRILALSLLFLLAAPAAAHADRFETVSSRETTIKGDVMDLAVSEDGRWSFVLTSHGEVVVLDSAGRVSQTIEVGNGYHRLEYNRIGNRLWLGGEQGRLRSIALSMRYDIDSSGSPFLGPEEAAVTITVFTDYQ